MKYTDYKYKATKVPIKNITNYFKDLNLNTNNFITADIGAFGGYTSYQMLEEITPKMHYIVDSYEFYDKWTHLKNFGEWKNVGGKLTNNDFNNVYLYTKSIFNKYNNVTIVKSYAEDFLKKFDDESFDFIFSGINVEPKLLCDIMRIVYKKIKRNGYISGYPYKSSSTYHESIKDLLGFKDVKKVSKVKGNIFLLKKEDIDDSY